MGVLNRFWPNPPAGDRAQPGLAPPGQPYGSLPKALVSNPAWKRLENLPCQSIRFSSLKDRVAGYRDHLTVMSLNTEFWLDPWAINLDHPLRGLDHEPILGKGEEALSALVHLFKYLTPQDQGPDIIALQEVENHHVLDAFLSRPDVVPLGYRYYCSSGSNNRVPLRLAFLYKADLSLIPEESRSYFQERDATGKPLFGKDLLQATFRVPVGPDRWETVSLFNCHLKSPVGKHTTFGPKAWRETAEKRLREVSAIQQQMSRYQAAHPEATLLLLGDFNTELNGQNPFSQPVLDVLAHRYPTTPLPDITADPPYEVVSAPPRQDRPLQAPLFEQPMALSLVDGLALPAVPVDYTVGFGPDGGDRFDGIFVRQQDVERVLPQATMVIPYEWDPRSAHWENPPSDHRAVVLTLKTRAAENIYTPTGQPQQVVTSSPRIA
ncbi:MAG: hypothetical protein SFZ03_03450 [Candidatus Melainabacteria bacterium]|nr:hypothetical protein [Candidatus Melainabacteria bacterium]